MKAPTSCCSIGRIGQELDLGGIPDSIVDSLLTWGTILEPCNDSPQGFRSRRVSTPLLEHGSPQLGLADLLTYCCLREGIIPHLSLMGRPLGKRCATNGLPIATSDEHVLDFVHHHPHGMITYGRKVDPAIVCAQIVHALPETPMAFLTGSKGRGRQFCSQLTSILGRPIVFADANTAPDERDQLVAVATFYGSQQVYPELEHRRLVVVLDAEEATSEQGQFALSRCLGANLFAFCSLGRHVPPRARDRISRTFGFYSVAVPKHGQRLRPVVTMERKLSGVSPASWQRNHNQGNSESIHTACITKNHVRTRQIARSAQHILQQPQAWGIAVPTSPSFGPALRVVLVAADPAHAARFAKQLPSWSLYLQGPMAAKHPAVVANPQQYTSVWSPIAPGIITTPFGLATINNKWIDILIWAVGDEYGPAISPYRLSQPLTDERPLYLLDFLDDYHRLTRQRSHKRARNYARNEWLPAGVDPHTHRIKSFLAHHDRVREQFDVA